MKLDHMQRVSGKRELREIFDSKGQKVTKCAIRSLVSCEI
jgi:hypothetical protein